MEIKKLVVNNIELCRFSKPIEVKNDDFLFEIIRDGETILLVNNEPISVVWHDNGPSSVHFYTLQGISIDKEIKKKLDDFESSVQDTLPIDYNLLALFEVYKPLLKSGSYRVFYSPPHSYEVGNHLHNKRKLRPFSLILPEEKGNLYLDEGVFMFTQSIETINQKRVDFYIEQILNGKSPTIITLGMQPKDESPEDTYSQFVDSYPQFIIDGHHKAIAYNTINKKRRIKGLPYEVLVPGIFSIVKIPTNDVNEKLLESKRQGILSKVLTNEEASAIIEFYNNW